MELSVIIMLSALGIFFTINIPISFAIILSSLVFILINGGIRVETLVQRMVNGTDSFPLLAIPFFILAGELMNRGGITWRLVKLASAMVGHLTGGLAHVNVVTNTLMAGLSGSSVADAAGIGKVLIPAMAENGYKKSFAAAVTAAGATIAPIIPPSIGMIIYAAISGASVGRLFIGGIVPGALLCLSLMGTIYIISIVRGYKIKGSPFSWVEFFRELKSSFFALLMPIIILVGIRGGVFTATEAAAVAAVYAAMVGLFVYKEIRLNEIPGILLEAAIGTSIIGIIMAAATPFGWILAWQRIPQTVTAWLAATTSDPILILVFLNIFLLILGTFMDSVPIMVILLPVVMPIVVKVGIDPVHFGLIMLINLMVGGLTPPYGLLLFTVSAISKVPLVEVIKQVLPFLFTVILVLVLITYVPAIVLFLPDLLMGAAR